MPPSVTPGPRGRKGDVTRNQILDACEILFARSGYLGTSLRDIAAEAGVRMGVVHYHFGNKHLIMDAAVERKLDLLRRTIVESFDTAKRGGQSLDAKDAITAFISPFLQAVADREGALQNYIVMTSHLMSGYRIPELRPVLSKLSVVSQILIDHLKDAFPGVSDEALLAGVYFVEAALIFIVQDPGFLDDLTGGHHSVFRLDELTRRALQFFHGGLSSVLTSP
ncbi:transcriptional regulator [Novosphingobium sp. Leaf2]|nr:transcriptional regulator [Novosphingobium sp. Leaf2]